MNVVRAARAAVIRSPLCELVSQKLLGVDKMRRGHGAHFSRLTFAGRLWRSRDDRPLLGYDTPTGLPGPRTPHPDVTLLGREVVGKPSQCDGST